MCLRLICSVEMNGGRALPSLNPNHCPVCPTSFRGRRSSSSSSSSLLHWLGAMRKIRSIFEETSCVVYRKVLCDVHIFLPVRIASLFCLSVEELHKCESDMKSMMSCEYPSISCHLLNIFEGKYYNKVIVH